MTYRKVAFCVVDSDYIDPAIVALTSFFRFNSTKVVCYVEEGTNFQRLKQATAGHPIEFRSVEFPQFQIHETLGNKYLELFVSRKSLPAFAMRILALQELKKEADIIINFDLDVMFFNTIQFLIDRCDDEHIYGVSERKNRDRWMVNLNLNEIICNPVYINTGFVVYGAKAISDNLLDEYERFLHDFSKDIYCPEQDFVNHRFVNEIREIPAHFNLMFTDERYTQIAPVMVHFIGADKPWTDTTYHDISSKFYFKRYKLECRKCREYIGDNFYNKIAKKVDNLYM